MDIISGWPDFAGFCRTGNRCFRPNIFSGLNRPKILFYSPFQWIVELMTDLEKSEHKNASSTELSNKGAVPGIEKLRDIRLRGI